MRINRYHMRNGKLPLWPIFLAGLLSGVLIMNFGKSILLDKTGLLDEYTLYHMKYMSVDSSALFFYVCGLRFKSFLIQVVLSTTYLGLFVCSGFALWYGLTVGAFLAALMIRYGLKGFLFAVLSVFPQGILYAPAMILLLLWCEAMNRNIYFKDRSGMDQEGVRSLPKRLLKLGLIAGLLLLGCLAESFVNPGVMEWLLQIF